MWLKSILLLAAMALTATAQAPVKVTGYKTGTTCKGAGTGAKSYLVETCNKFPAAVHAYKTNGDAGECEFYTYSDTACQDQTQTAKLLANGVCETVGGTNVKAKSFQILCGG